MLDIKIDELGYGKDSCIIRNLRLKLHGNDCLFVEGSTGSGKTTLLKLLSGIIPEIQKSYFQGEIKFGGKHIDFREYSKVVSASFQEPESQFLLNSVEKEIFIFLGEKERQRAKQLVGEFSIGPLLHKALRDISSGQKKLVSLITALSRESLILILDEPTSNLDECNTKRLIKILKRMKGKIIIIASHDDSLKLVCNRFLLLRKNELLPNAVKRTDRRMDGVLLEAKPASKDRDIVFSLKDVSYSYPDGTRPFFDLNMDLRRGDVVMVVGGNGAGKTTLLNILGSNIKPSKGKIERSNRQRVAFIFQEPEKQLFASSVLDEVLLTQRDKCMQMGIARRYLARIGLGRKLHEHPFFLSRGQKQSLLLLSVLITKPDILIIDEPFTGLDDAQARIFLNLLSEFYVDDAPLLIIASQKPLDAVHATMEVILKNETVIVRDRK